VSRNEVVISHQSTVISRAVADRTASGLETDDWRRATTRERGEQGFTLIELLVVASILVVLAGIGLVQYRNGKTRASEAVLKTDLFNMRDGIDQYYADKGMYPATLDELVSSGYLRKVPDDPFTTSASTWQTVASEPDPNNPNAPPGVYDVKSGSDATALDGTKYADW
jgi:general secretion pathway protein G